MKASVMCQSNSARNQSVHSVISFIYEEVRFFAYFFFYFFYYFRTKTQRIIASAS